MDCTKILVVLMSIFSLILADNINMIEIKTSDCDDCGMGTFGELRMQVCIMIQ